MNNTLLRQMLMISRQMAETHNLDKLLDFAMEQTLEIVGAELCYLVMLNADGSLNTRASSVNSDLVEIQTDDPLSRTIFNQVVTNGEPLVISDALADERYASHSSVINLNIRSVMCVPLISGGKTMGVLYVENRSITGAFRQDDLEPLIFFANQAAASIENTMIISELEKRVVARTAQLEASWHDAVEANKMRTLLLGQLAHDLRTPLSITMMSISTLTDSKHSELTDMQRKWVERSLEGVRQLDQLIENIFDLSKSDMNALEIRKEPVDMFNFLQGVFDIAGVLPWRSGVSFEISIPETLPVLAIDAVRIRQVLMNLISNALKFTPDGTVTLHATLLEDELHVGVHDTGEGIPEEALDKVFERFMSADEDVVRRSKGAGLGLAICKELVEKHDGRIFVKSTPGEGSDFVFSLPV